MQIFSLPFKPSSLQDRIDLLGGRRRCRCLAGKFEYLPPSFSFTFTKRTRHLLQLRRRFLPSLFFYYLSFAKVCICVFVLPLVFVSPQPPPPRFVILCPTKNILLRLCAALRPGTFVMMPPCAGAAQCLETTSGFGHKLRKPEAR